MNGNRSNPVLRGPGRGNALVLPDGPLYRPGPGKAPATGSRRLFPQATQHHILDNQEYR